MRFQYSPGLIGYGAKGTDGSSGLQGLAIYFTDYNPLSDKITLISAIENNEVLWSTAIPGTKLPGERKYFAGDLIVDSRGFVYRITDTVNVEYINTEMSLNKSAFFQKGIQSNNGFERYFNKLDPSLRYIIDNVFTDNLGINYTLFPSKIYGISPKNFARIEYSNINDASYNAFSLYSSGESADEENDHKSLAIVREIATNKFHIGNLDNSNLFRDVDLILDVSSLMINKSGNLFRNNTISGTVLTNTEKNANPLFNDSFILSPGSFICTSHSTSVDIRWVLSDFCSDPCSGILYFYKKETPGNFTMDSSRLRPLIFHNIGSGNITVSALTLNQTYEYFMSVCKNGWERNSEIRSITTTSIPVIFTIINPDPPALAFPAASSLKYATSISTDSFTGWTLTKDQSWISTLQTGTTIPFTGSLVAGNYTFDVSLSAYAGYNSRNGTITFNSETPMPKTIVVTQQRRLPIFHSVYMSTYVSNTTDARGRVNISPVLDSGQSITLTVSLKVKAHAHGSVSHNNVNITADMTLYKNGFKVADCSTFCHSAGGDNNTYYPITVTIPNVVNGDILEIRQTQFDSVHFTSGVNAHGESAGYLELLNAADGYDSFSVTDQGKQYWNVSKYYTTGIFNSYVSSVSEDWVNQ